MFVQFVATEIDLVIGSLFAIFADVKMLSLSQMTKSAKSKMTSENYLKKLNKNISQKNQKVIFIKWVS